MTDRHWQAPSDLHLSGPILDLIQMKNVLGDGKEFVDRPLRHPPRKVWIHWIRLGLATTEHPSDQQLFDWISENFEEAGNQLENFPPSDWKENLHLISKLKSKGLIEMVKEINRLWHDLGKHIKDEVKFTQNKGTLIYVPYNFIIPGGRFRSTYYWDTYWIIRALVQSEMFDTAKGIIQNFFYLIDKFGMVPNGTRTYYLDRSQPPFLISMVKHYLDNKEDMELLENNINHLITEMDWFKANRTVNFNKNGGWYEMFRYGSEGFGPRPESYKEDTDTAKLEKLTLEEEEVLYDNIRAGAESGWDFSTRWMVDNDGGVSSGMKFVKTMSVAPVDLNALMYKNYVNLAEMLDKVDRKTEADNYRQIARTLQKAVMDVMFEPKSKTWRDYDIKHARQRPYYFASNLYPLWCSCIPEDRRVELGEAAATYLQEGKFIQPGGLLTSQFESEQQWDAPNCWAPLQQIVVSGLLKCGGPLALKTAKQIATNFTVTAYSAFQDGGLFYEKYHANRLIAGGGEYEVQTGFGWTNGVILDFIQLFGDDLLANNEKNEEPVENTEPIENKEPQPLKN